MKKLANKFDELQLLVQQIDWMKKSIEPIGQNRCTSVQLSFRVPAKEDSKVFDYQRFDIDAFEDDEVFTLLEETVVALVQKRLHAMNQKMQLAIEDLQTTVKEFTA